MAAAAAISRPGFVSALDALRLGARQGGGGSGALPGCPVAVERRAGQGCGSAGWAVLRRPRRDRPRHPGGHRPAQRPRPALDRATAPAQTALAPPPLSIHPLRNEALVTAEEGIDRAVRPEVEVLGGVDGEPGPVRACRA